MGKRSTGLSAFIICPIGKDESDERKRSDWLFETILDPVLKEKESNFNKIERSDFIDKQGNITNQIIDRLIKTDLVLADLTDGNPNVYYELSIRHCFRKPFVHLIEKDKIESIHFDISHERVFDYCYNDPNYIKQSKDKLRKILRNINYDCPHIIDNPVANATDLISLRQIDFVKMFKTIIDTHSQMELLRIEMNNNTSRFNEFIKSIQQKYPSDKSITNIWDNYLGGYNLNRPVISNKCLNCGSTNTTTKEQPSLFDTCFMWHSPISGNYKIKKCNNCGYEELIPNFL